MRHFFRFCKDYSDYLAFEEITWSYSNFFYCSTFLFKPLPLCSQPIQICCSTMTNMQTDLQYLHLQCTSYLSYTALCQKLYLAIFARACHFYSFQLLLYLLCQLSLVFHENSFFWCALYQKPLVMLLLMTLILSGRVQKINL